MGLDYAKAKRMQSARGCRPETFGPRSSSLQGWRTEWDGEPFPVTTTLIKAGDNTMDTMRAIDGNGHVPVEYTLTEQAEELLADSDPCTTMVEHMAQAVAVLFQLAGMFGVTAAELAAKATGINERRTA